MGALYALAGVPAAVDPPRCLAKPEAARYVAVGSPARRRPAGLCGVSGGESPSQRPLAWMGAGLPFTTRTYTPGRSRGICCPMLPLSPLAARALFTSPRSLSISATAYYALVFIGNCLQDELAIAVTDLIEATSIVMVPPTISFAGPPRHDRWRLPLALGSRSDLARSPPSSTLRDARVPPRERPLIIRFHDVGAVPPLRAPALLLRNLLAPSRWPRHPTA